jgi:O-antigen/teichoic acid export membrane protein
LITAFVRRARSLPADNCRQPPNDSWSGLVRALSVTASGDGLGKVALAISLVIAGRNLRPVAFAQLASLQAVAIVSSSLWDFGVGAITTRRLSSGDVSPGAAVKRVVRLRIATFPLLAAAFASLAFAVSNIGSPSPAVIAVMFGVSFVFGTNTITVCVLRGTFRFAAAGAGIGAGRIVMLGAVAVAAKTGPSLLGFAVALLVGEVATFLFLLSRLTTLGSARAGSRFITLRSAAPYALAGVMQVAYNRVDTVVVSAIASSTVAANFVPASRAQDALYVVPATLAAVALPLQSRFCRNPACAAASLRRAIVVGLCISVAVAAGLTLGAPALVRGFLGPSYEGTIVPVQIIAWSLPAVTVNALLYATVIARGLRNALILANTLALASAVLLNLVLVPPFGAVGGSFAALAREIPIGLILMLAIRRIRPASRSLFAPAAIT